MNEEKDWQKLDDYILKLQYDPNWKSFSVKITYDRKIPRDEHSVYDVLSLTHIDWIFVLDCMYFMRKHMIRDLETRRYKIE